MLVYEKKVDGVRHLFGTVNNIPSNSDNQLVYQDADGDTVSPSLSYQYLDDGHGGITMVDAEGTETFVAVNIKKADNSLVNIIPGGSYEPEAKVLKSIRFKKKPTKTTYVAGDSIDITGAVIEATWESGEKSVIDNTDCTFTPSSALATTDTEITASYTYPAEGASQVTKTATCAITVNES